MWPLHCHFAAYDEIFIGPQLRGGVSGGKGMTISLELTDTRSFLYEKAPLVEGTNVPLLGAAVHEAARRIVGPSALDFAPPSFDEIELPNATASLTLVESTKSAREAMSLDASWNVSYGVSDASGQLDMARSVRTNERDLHLLLSIAVASEEVTLDHAELKNEHRFGADDLRRSQFYRGFGDAYVQAVSLGGEYNLLLSFHTRGRTEKESIRVQLEGAYGASGASAEFASKMEQVSRSSSVTILAAKRGGGDLLPEGSLGLKSLSKLLESVNSIVEAIGTYPVAYRWRSASYASASTGGAPPQFRDSTEERQLLMSAGHWLEDLDDRRELLEYALEHPWQFEPFDVGQAASALAATDDFDDLLSVELAPVLNRTNPAASAPALRERLAAAIAGIGKVEPHLDPLYDVLEPPPAGSHDYPFSRRTTTWKSPTACRRKQYETLTPGDLRIAAVGTDDTRAFSWSYSVDVDRWRWCKSKSRRYREHRTDEHGQLVGTLRVDQGQLQVEVTRDTLEDQPERYSKLVGQDLRAFLRAKDQLVLSV